MFSLVATSDFWNYNVDSSLGFVDDVHTRQMPVEYESHFPCPRQMPSLENSRAAFRPKAIKFPPRPEHRKK
jgi:hypothetical protein